MELKDYFSEEKLDDLRREIIIEMENISINCIGKEIYESEMDEYVSVDVFNDLANIAVVELEEIIHMTLGLKEEKIEIYPQIEVENNEYDSSSNQRAYVSYFEIRGIKNLTEEQEELFYERRDEILDLFSSLYDELDVNISVSFKELEVENEDEEDKMLKVYEIS